MSSGRGESWSTHVSDLCLGVGGSHITEDQGLYVSWFGDFGGSSGDPLMSYFGGFLFINGEESGNQNKDGFACVAASVPAEPPLLRITPTHRISEAAPASPEARG